MKDIKISSLLTFRVSFFLVSRLMVQFSLNYLADYGSRTSLFFFLSPLSRRCSSSSSAAYMREKNARELSSERAAKYTEILAVGGDGKIHVYAFLALN